MFVISKNGCQTRINSELILTSERFLVRNGMFQLSCKTSKNDQKTPQKMKINSHSLKPYKTSYVISNPHNSQTWGS